MDRDPSEALEQFVAGQVQSAVAGDAPGVVRVEPGKRGGGRVRAAAAFLAFFLGASLTLGSLGAGLGRLAWERDNDGWWKGDWQETQVFRDTVSDYLEDFLTLGAGGHLDWWTNNTIAQEYGYDATAWSGRGGVTISTYAEAGFDTSRLTAPDDYYKNDKNVLYRIARQGTSPVAWYTNTEKGQGLTAYKDLPEGYNFLLVYENGKVAITKDGQAVDVYGDGFFNDSSRWYVPGYENFPAGPGVENVRVYMAVRQVPARYLQGNYANGGTTSNNRLYWLYQSIVQSQTFFRNAALVLAAGLALLVLAFLLRRDRRAADEKIASWTVHVWTEVRFLAVAGGLLALFLGSIRNLADYGYGLWYEFAYEGFSAYGLSRLARGLTGLLENTPALLFLFWTLWLIHNDHKHNPKAGRRCLSKLAYRALRGKELKLPVQKRLARYRFFLLAGLALVFLVSLPFAYNGILMMARYSYGWGSVDWLVVFFLYLMDALVLFAIFYVWKSGRSLAKDVGLLADQVDAIRDGDLETPLTLPEDADLRQTAEHLNDIQSGMHRALAEQTRSERMKVELISNVSHDLKTPLTSILSYAELLRQEDLPPAAADYARIIDEKAQRLKTMVQDVFDVSKATADQLPVHLERLDFAKLLRQTLADMADPIARSALTFKTDLPETPVEIVADGKRLYRVFQNLIQNALQYALEGSRVYLTLTLRGGTAEAAVRNTSRTELPDGVDFTARFVRGDESRTDGGSGLGLSIASSFTEACGGAFRVETVADLFTAVVTFPLAGEE